MRCSWTINGRDVAFELRPDPEDPLVGAGQAVRHYQVRMKVQLAANRCHFRLPIELQRDPHPDLLAAAAYSIAKPWTSSRLRVDRPISQPMAETFARFSGIEAGPVDPQLEPRVPGRQTLLSYSGGVDSIAASLMLSKTTPYVHLRRVSHPSIPNRATHFKADVQADLVAQARDHGRNVYVVDTDVEYLCLPLPTFPEWTAIGVASVLLADELDAGGIVFGNVIDMRYLDNGRHFIYRTGDRVEPFATAALPVIEPIAGISEGSSMAIASNSDLYGLARSCLLGDHDRPCLACLKCLRKEMEAAVLHGQPLPLALMEAFEHGIIGAEELDNGQPPFWMQSLLEWLLVRLDVSGTPLQRVKEIIDPDPDRTTWMTAYYPRAITDRVPEEWVVPTRSFLDRHLRRMTDEEVRTVEAWGHPF